MAKTRKNSSTPARPATPREEEDSFDMASVKEAASLSKTGLVIAGSLFVLFFLLSLMTSPNDGSATAPPVEVPAEASAAVPAEDAMAVGNEAAADAEMPGRIIDFDFPDLAAACNEANTPSAGDRCTDLGIKYHNGDGVKKNAQRAVRLYNLGCDKGSMTACANAGLMYSGTNGIEARPEYAIQLLTRACVAELPHGCAELGYNYEHGVGVAQDKVRARQLYEWACNKNWSKACDYRDAIDRAGSYTPR